MTKEKQTRLKTRRGLAIYRQQYRHGGVAKYSRTWYYGPQVGGKRRAFPLGADAGVAKQQADRIYLFLQDPGNTVERAVERFNPKRRARAEVRDRKAEREATVGDIETLYLEHCRSLELRDQTAKQNVGKLFVMLRRARSKRRGEVFSGNPGARIDYSDLRAMPLSCLTSATVADMQASFLDEAEDMEDEVRAKRNANSYYLGARSVFSARAWELYEGRGLVLPDRANWPFLQGRLFKKLRGRKVMTKPIIVRRAFEALTELKAKDPNAYRAFMLATHCSLRRGEAGHAKWEWFRVDRGRVALEIPDVDGDFRPKGNKGRRVLVERWVYDELMAFRGSGGHIIEGSESERISAHNRPPKAMERLTKWLRAQGVSERLPYHNLRSWWFSAKVRLDGLLAAQQQGGHEDPQTTSDSYADNEMPDELLGYWRPEGQERRTVGGAG